jgi:hypothetical protein
VTGATGAQAPASLDAGTRRLIERSIRSAGSTCGPGGNRRYERCLQDSGADLTAAQGCADLVGQ